VLTLVTATLNAARFLDRALASAVQQQLPLQHLVIDGGSTDDTVAIARSQPTVETLVVPGCTLYEAWNLGIERARGDIVMFLNADDELGDCAVTEILAVAAGHPGAEIVAGNAEFVTAGGTRLLRAIPTDELDVGQLALGVPAINAMAFRRSLFARSGMFETCYRVAGDRAFLLRLALSSDPPRVARVDSVLYRYHVHGGSLTLFPGLEQRLRIARDHIALSRALLDQDPPASAKLWLRHMRRREAAVATLRCLAVGQPNVALEFARQL